MPNASLVMMVRMVVLVLAVGEVVLGQLSNGISEARVTSFRQSGLTLAWTDEIMRS
jgi:hypothetical protein